MSKRKAYKPKGKSLNAMVARFVNPFHFDLPEFITLDSFYRGQATEQSLKNLEDYMNLVLIANDMKPHTANHELADEFQVIVSSIFNRYFKTQKVGVNGEEREKLGLLINAYRNYWLTKSADFYNECLEELKRFYRERTEICAYEKKPSAERMAA